MSGEKISRVIQITRFGLPEVLQIKEEVVGKIGPDEVLIRVRAIGLNFADIFERMGLYKAAPKAPFVPGFEVAGIVEQVGGEVRGLKEGQRVVAVTKFGGYKSRVKVHQAFAFPMPDEYSFEEAAGLPTTYLTAYH
ncbi:MAG: alcohol dehydrogenase catalytic domain-containing protein, partial [bacterium]